MTEFGYCSFCRLLHASVKFVSLAWVQRKWRETSLSHAAESPAGNNYKHAVSSPEGHVVGKLQGIIWNAMKCYMALSKNNGEVLNGLRLMPKLHIKKKICRIEEVSLGGCVCELAYKTLNIKIKIIKYTKGKEHFYWNHLFHFFPSSLLQITPPWQKGLSLITCIPFHLRLLVCKMIGGWGREFCHCLLHYLEGKRSKLRSWTKRKSVWQAAWQYLFLGTEHWGEMSSWGTNYWRLLTPAENYFSQLPGFKVVTIKGEKLSAFNCTTISKKFHFMEDGEIAQPVRYLPGKHEDVHLIPRTLWKSLLRWYVLAIPGLERQRPVNSRDLPVWVTLWTLGNRENPLHKHHMVSTWERTPKIVLWPPCV